ncbi:hypothetical protein RhiJN_16733 [Ceratobasidium sp. AG-Ba]|nr:hypothetical protein RhiJN_16733 [Ceratobasidium sp. AG-Ba]
MADYQCPTCYETMDKPKHAPVALKCGHIMCSVCLPRTIKRGQSNHVCGICRTECAPQDVYRVYLPMPARSQASSSSSASVASGSSGVSLSDAQLNQAQAIAQAASVLGVESTEAELKKVVTSAEQWFVGIDQRSVQSSEALDVLLTAITDLRRKLVYAVRLDSAKELQRETRMEVDMYRNELAGYEARLRQTELEVAEAQREATRWEKHAKRAEARAAQWEQQANALEERRYTESIRAEGAVSILRSQISVLQKEVREQTQRKLKYKKKQSSSSNERPSCCCVQSDDSLEIFSATSTADEAEVSTAFSVPTVVYPDSSKHTSTSQAQTSTPPHNADSDDDDSQTVIYGPPPSQPLLRVPSFKKRKLSDASDSTTTSTASIPPPLRPEEQAAREGALDNRFSKRLRTARQQGVKEGWVPPDWKARVVMADRIKEMKNSRKRPLDSDAERTPNVTNEARFCRKMTDRVPADAVALAARIQGELPSGSGQHYAAMVVLNSLVLYSEQHGLLLERDDRAVVTSLSVEYLYLAWYYGVEIKLNQGQTKYWPHQVWKDSANLGINLKEMVETQQARTMR